VFRRHQVFEGPIGKRIHRFVRGNQFRVSFYSPTFDPLKREIFFLPVRWHAGPLNAKWNAVEQKAMRTLRRWVAPPQSGDASMLPLNLQQRSMLALWRSIQYIPTFLIYHKLILRRLGQAARGDREAILRIAWHIRRELSTLVGRTFDEPPPRPPSTT